MQNEKETDPGPLQGSTRTGTPGRWKAILLTVTFLAGLLLILWAMYRTQLAPAVPVRVAKVILLPQEQDDATAPMAGESGSR